MKDVQSLKLLPACLITVIFWRTRTWRHTPASTAPMASKSASSGVSLVLPEALDDVFDIIDVNRDGVLTVQEFILVRYEPDIGPHSRSPLVAPPHRSWSLQSCSLR